MLKNANSKDFSYHTNQKEIAGHASGMWNQCLPEDEKK